MKFKPKTALSRCETLMLDMDGTLLDLAYDVYMWMQHVPERYAAANGLEAEEARQKLMATYRKLEGTLDWYCLDHWSEHLGIDVAALHREQNHRIGYLPGAEEFLRGLRSTNLRVLLVTNSHVDTLNIKNEATGLCRHFDGVHSSHEFGQPKETQEFWRALAEVEDFDPATTLFVDDTPRVLKSAQTWGIGMLLQITDPDSSGTVRHDTGEFRGIDGVRNLV